jgi:Icc-related predicted phosphoesterase
MKIAFIGDVHGRVYHALAAVLTLKTRLRGKLDLIIQVGDLGAFPDHERLDEATRRYAERDPSELHFSHLLGAKDTLAHQLRIARARLAVPIHFIRGNHEDMDWLAGLRKEGRVEATPVDPFGLFHHVEDGAVIDFGGFRVAFLGGVEYGAEEGTRFEQRALDELNAVTPRSVDLLVTHDAPYGVSVGYLGRTQGSAVLSDLVAHLEPAYHVAGHYHHMIGPSRYGRTTYIGLASLFPGRRGGQPLQDGSLAVLDTSLRDLSFVTEGWLKDFGADFAFEKHFATLAN